MCSIIFQVFCFECQSLNWTSWVQEENSVEATEVIEVIQCKLMYYQILTCVGADGVSDQREGGFTQSAQGRRLRNCGTVCHVRHGVHIDTESG